MNLNEFELNVKARPETGSASAKMLLKEERVPLVIYGKNAKTLSGSINLRELEKALKSTTLFNKFTTLNYEENNKIEKMLVFAKVVQKESVKERILHIDFQLVEKNEDVKMRIPVRFLNKDLCEAIKLGGLLNMACYFVELTGKAEKMPAYLDYDLKNADVGISIKVEDFKIPSEIKIVKKYEKRVVATILAAKKKGSDKESEDAAKEGAAE